MSARINHILAFLGVVILLAEVGHGQVRTPSGGMAGAALRMGFGARGMGLGNAMTAMADGDISAYYNPALVPLQSRPVGLAAFGVLSLDRRLNFLSYTQALKPNAGLSLGIINAGVSNIDGRDRDGAHIDTYSTSENAFLFSFGIKFDQLSVGVSAKLLYYSLFSGVSSSTVGFDLGALYSISDQLRIGVVLQDVNSKYKWDTSQLYGLSGNATTDRFPLRKRIAVSYSPEFVPAIAAVEYELIGSAATVRTGLEMTVAEGLQVRAGVDQISPSGDVSSKPALGMSFQTDMIPWRPGIQYTYVFEPYSPAGIHMISLTLRFE